jgi:hypothetical protein
MQGLKNDQFQNRHHQQQKLEPGGYRLGTVIDKTICQWKLKSGYRVHKPKTCLNSFSYEQTSTSCFVELAPIHP